MASATDRGGSVVAPWGLIDAVLAYLAGTVGSGIVAAALHAGPESSIVARFFATIPLWIAFIATPLVVTRTRGRGPTVDLGLAVRPADLLAVVAGGVAQLAITAAYLPFVSRSELEAPSRVLVDHAPGAGRWLLVVMTCVIAPLTEELFYRGLVMRALERRFAPWVAALVAALAFGASHFQLLQLPGLVVFGLLAGLLAQRSGRLGTAMAAHLGFNAVAVWSLLR